MRRPNFFLVGAPRCGTTAIFRWLRRHRHVFLPAHKECHYFAEDLAESRPIQSGDQYRALFCAAKAHHRAIGEASVLYLCSDVAIKKILQYEPQARLIVALRNPIDMIYSWHQQLLVTLQEDQADFARAWSLQADRVQGRAVPAHCTIPLALQYAKIGCLGTQVARLLSQCDREQVHFVFYDDLVRDAKGTYEGVLKALGVTPDGYNSFSVVNQNAALPTALLQRLWLRNAAIGKLRQRLRSVVGDRIYDGMRDTIMPRLLLVKERVPLPARTRQLLRARFRAEVDHLEHLLERDLRHWLAA